MDTSNYGYITLRLFVKDIVSNIGFSNLYTNHNKSYPNAPAGFHLFNLDNVMKWVKASNPIISNIYIIEDERMDESIFGIYINKGSNVYITINGNLNSCWRRFATLKELCSLYVDHNDVSGKMKKYQNYLDSVGNAFTQKANLLKEDKFSDSTDMDSETFSILLATELMLPYNHRDLLKQQFLEFENGQLKMNDIAKSLLIPEFILNLFYEKKLIDATPNYDDI